MPLASASVEIYFVRAAANYELEDAAAAIHDLNRALALRGDHAPSLALRAKARCALGQYPEGKRDCIKARRLLLTAAGLPHHADADLTPAMEAILAPLDLVDIEAEVRRGLDVLHLLGVDDRNAHRIYDVTPEGMLLRRRSELAALDTVGRSKERDRLELCARKHDALLASEGAIFEAEENEVFAARALSDRAHADLAFRSARYYLERLEDEKRRKIEREAQRVIDAANEASRAAAMVAVERAWMDAADPRVLAAGVVAPEKPPPAAKKPRGARRGG